MMAAGRNITSALRVVEPMLDYKKQIPSPVSQISHWKNAFLIKLCFYRKSVSDYFYNYLFFSTDISEWMFKELVCAEMA